MTETLANRSEQPAKGAKNMERLEMLEGAETLCRDMLQEVGYLGDTRYEQLVALKNDHLAIQTLAKDLLTEAAEEIYPGS